MWLYGCYAEAVFPGEDADIVICEGEGESGGGFVASVGGAGVGCEHFHKQGVEARGTVFGSLDGGLCCRSDVHGDVRGSFVGEAAPGICRCLDVRDVGFDIEYRCAIHEIHAS